MSVGDWLRRLFHTPSATPSSPDSEPALAPHSVYGVNTKPPVASPLPEGWTDDMIIHVCPPQTLEELVESVLQAEVRKEAYDATVSALMINFGLSEEDAALAWDRTLGGLVRAATNIPANCPNPVKDPVAWISYQRCTRDRSLIVAIRPKYIAGS